MSELDEPYYGVLTTKLKLMDALKRHFFSSLLLLHHHLQSFLYDVGHIWVRCECCSHFEAYLASSGESNQFTRNAESKTMDLFHGRCNWMRQNERSITLLHIARIIRLDN